MGRLTARESGKMNWSARVRRGMRATRKDGMNTNKEGGSQKAREDGSRKVTKLVNSWEGGSRLTDGQQAVCGRSNRLCAVHKQETNSDLSKLII